MDGSSTTCDPQTGHRLCLEQVVHSPGAAGSVGLLHRCPDPRSPLVSGRRDLLLSPKKSNDARGPDLWTLKFFNPLSFGAPYRPFDIRLERLNRRSCFWLFNSIKRGYLRRKRMHRKPLHRLMDQSLDIAWPKLLDRLGDLTLEDIEPIGYMASCVTQSMMLHFPSAGPLSHWRPLFDSFWPHGLPSS